jgi:hypothetical protein
MAVTMADAERGDPEPLPRRNSLSSLRRAATAIMKVPLRERLHHFTFAWYTLT